MEWIQNLSFRKSFGALFAEKIFIDFVKIFACEKIP